MSRASAAFAPLTPSTPSHSLSAPSSVATFSFPILKNKEILTCLRELGLNLTLDELQKCDPALIKPLYERLLELLTGTVRDSLRQPDFTAMMDTLLFPELHEESLCEMQIQQHLLKLFRVCGVHDASIRDFLDPNPKRTKQILSALINFAKFREEKLSLYGELNAKTEQLVAERSQEQEDFQELMGEYQSRKAQVEAENAEFIALKAEIQQLQGEVNNLGRVHSQLREQVKQTKNQSLELNDSISAEKFTLLNVQKEVEKLRGQIVRSPEKMKRTLVDLTNFIGNEKKEIGELNGLLRSSQSKLHVYNGLEGQLKEELSLAGDVESELGRLKKVMVQVKEQRELVKSLNVESIELQAQENDFKGKIESGQAKLFHLQKQFEQRKMAASQALTAVQSERMNLQREMAIEKEKIAANQEILKQKRQRLVDNRAAHDAALALIRAKYSDLEQAVKNYHLRIINQMAAVDSTMQGK